LDIVVPHINHEHQSAGCKGAYFTCDLKTSWHKY